MGKTQMGIILIIISSVFILLGLFRKRNNFIDLNSVFVKHFSMFKTARIQFIVIYICTLILAIGISLVYVADGTLYQNIIVVMSIFASMLMAMLSVIKSKDLSKYNGDEKKRIDGVMKETDAQVMYCTCICMFEIIVSLIMIALSNLDIPTILTIMSVITYYLIEILTLNILIVVKRLGKLT